MSGVPDRVTVAECEAMRDLDDEGLNTSEIAADIERHPKTVRKHVGRYCRHEADTTDAYECEHCGAAYQTLPAYLRHGCPIELNRGEAV